MRQYVLYFYSSRWAIPVLTALIIGSTAWGMVPEITTHDNYPDYYMFMAPYVYGCDPGRFEGETARNPLKWWLNCLSFHTTGSHKTLVFPFAVGLMPLVYFLGRNLSGDRFVGLIAVIAFTWNPLYMDWATNGTYDQVWAFFLLLSFYTLTTKWEKTSIISYLIAGMAKFMSVLYLPVWLYLAIQKRHWWPVFIMAAGAATLGVVAVQLDMTTTLVGNTIGFYPEDLEQAIFRNISLFWQVLPVLLGVIGISMAFKPRERFNKKVIWFFMLWTFALTPIIHLFSEQLTFSYRYAPFAAFMSIFIGMTVVELGRWYSEIQLNKKVPNLS